MKFFKLLLFFLTLTLSSYSQEIRKVYVQDNFFIIQRPIDGVVISKVRLDFQDIKSDLLNKSIWIKNANVNYNFSLDGFYKIDGSVWGETVESAITAFSLAITTPTLYNSSASMRQDTTNNILRQLKVSIDSIRKTNNDVRDLIKQIKPTTTSSGDSFSTNSIVETTTQGALSTNAFLRFRSTSLTNAIQVVKSTTGNIYGINIINKSFEIVYVKLFDASVVTLGTSVPVETIAVAANSVYRSNPTNIPFAFHNINSIKIVAVTGIADTDVTAPTVPLLIEIKYN